jgi:hypothetical protein
VVASVMVNTVTVANVVSVNVVTMPAINVTAAGGLTNAELRASAVSVAVTTMPALSISSVSISNFPASQTVAGTVTANGGDFINSDDALITKDSAKNVVLIGGLAYSTTPTQSQIQAFQTQGDGTLKIYQEVTNWTDTNAGNQPRAASQQTPFPVQVLGGSVTIGSLPAISGTVTANVGNLPSALQANTWATIGDEIGWGLNAAGLTVDVATLPAISGTVTVSSLPASTVTVSNFSLSGYNYDENLDEPLPIRNDSDDRRYVPIGPVNDQDAGGSLPIPVINSSGGSLSISGTVTANVDVNSRIKVLDSNGDDLVVNPINGGLQTHINNSLTIGSLPAISGTVTIGNSITIGAFSTSVTARLINPAGTAVTYAEVGTAGNPSIDVLSVQGVSGGTNLPIAGSVTISGVPNGALTTRFGSVVTANTALLTAAVTNSARRYLLIQNVTTSSNVITVGVGFTPTTTQGIQLTAGAGITFESSYIPTGAVYILSSVTASTFTILEA